MPTFIKVDLTVIVLIGDEEEDNYNGDTKKKMDPKYIHNRVLLSLPV